MKYTGALQLQMLDARKRAYVPVGLDVPEKYSERDAFTEALRRNGKPWRIAKADRPLKPPRINSSVPLSSGRTVADVQRDYLTWAQSKGLTSITAYDNKYPNNYAQDKTFYGSKGATGRVIFTGTIHQITLADHFAVTDESDYGLEQAAA